MGFKAVIKHLTITLVTLVTGGVACADEFFRTAHPGYTDDVREERLQVTREVIIVPPLQPDTVRLVDRIFTQKLTKEFTHEFRQRFGYTEFEQISVTSNRFVGDSQAERLMPYDEYIEKQEDFGQYIAKELTEYHVDNYLRSSPDTRAIYETKEKLSNVEVATKSGYKYKLRYRLASNRLTFRMEKPRQRFYPQIDVKASGENPTLRLAYDMSKVVRLSTDFAIDDEIFSVRGERRLTPTLVTSITGQSYQKTIGETPAQDRVLLGLSWND